MSSNLDLARKENRFLRGCVFCLMLISSLQMFGFLHLERLQSQMLGDCFATKEQGKSR